VLFFRDRPFEEWGKLLGDVPAAGAILDRFLHHAEVVPMQGRSYRLMNRQEQSPFFKPFLEAWSFLFSAREPAGAQEGGGRRPFRARSIFRPQVG